MHFENVIDNTLFKCALYIRLSREDGDDLESESISNQRNLLHDYITREGLSFASEYIDDGYSGGNFNRPSFNRMIKDIESGLVNCVITKDLSRLGRDHIDTGRFIERYFPENNIRYIAVNDRFDTFDETKDDDMVPIKLSMNDMYAKDISKKVRSVKYNQMRDGKFASGYVSYGYKRDPKNKYHLIPDPEYAPIVKRIFDLYISGLGTSAIAHILTAEKVKTPVQVKNHPSQLKNSFHPEIWKYKTVTNILRNPIYTGKLVQHKYQNISHKTKKRRILSEDKWIVTENAHEPIISEEVFDLASSIRNRSNYYDPNHVKNDYLLRGLVFCKDCGSRMSISHDKSRDRVTMNCATYRRLSKYNICTSKYINYRKFEEIILNKIKDMSLEYKKDKEEFEELLRREYKDPKIEIENKINSYNKRIETLKIKQDTLYDDKFSGIIDSNTYKRLFSKVNDEIRMYNDKLIKCKKELAQSSNFKNEMSEIMKVIDDFVEFKNPTKEMLCKVIDKIYITHNKEIEVYYKIKQNA